MTLEQYITKQTSFWRRQNISKHQIAEVTTMEQAKWLDYLGNLEMFNNNLQRT